MKSSVRGRRVRVLLSAVSVLVVLGLSLAACSSNSDSSSSSSPGSGSSSSAGSGSQSSGDVSSYLAAAQQIVQQGYKGTDRALPSSSPPPAKNKSVWVISLSQALAGEAIPADAAMVAGKALGWNMHLVDGQGNNTTINAAVEDAIAAKANGIVLAAIDCGQVKSALQRAVAAGIKVSGLLGLDCNDPLSGGNGPSLFSSGIGYPGGEGAFTQQLGETMAVYVIAKTAGTGSILEITEHDNAVTTYAYNGANAELAKCTQCKVYKLNITYQNILNNQLQSMVQAALAQHPNVQWVMAPYDAAIPLGISAAIQASGRAGQIKLMGNGGFASNITLIRQGKQTADVGNPAQWTGWAAVDELNRVFNGKPQVDEGFGYQFIDSSHNMPSGDQGYTGNARSDWEQNFLHIWGVK